MWFRIARMLGMTVAMAKDSMPASEFMGWMAFLDQDPDPDVKRQNEAAAIQSTFASVMSGKKTKISDYVLKYKSRNQAKTPDQIKNGLRHWFAMNAARNQLDGQQVPAQERPKP